MIESVNKHRRPPNDIPNKSSKQIACRNVQKQTSFKKHSSNLINHGRFNTTISIYFPASSEPNNRTQAFLDSNAPGVSMASSNPRDARCWRPRRCLLRVAKARPRTHLEDARSPKTCDSCDPWFQLLHTTKSKLFLATLVSFHIRFHSLLTAISSRIFSVHWLPNFPGEQSSNDKHKHWCLVLNHGRTPCDSYRWYDVIWHDRLRMPPISGRSDALPGRNSSRILAHHTLASKSSRLLGECFHLASGFIDR